MASAELLSISVAGNTDLDLISYRSSRENTKAYIKKPQSSLQFAPPLVSTNVDTVLCFDFLRHAHLKPFIRNLQISLEPSASVTFEFTTLGSSIASFSTPFILCALPYLPRQRDGRLLCRRTSNPLLASLHQIIELATSGSSPFVIESVRNVSGEYATILDTITAELEDNRQQRNSFIEQFGKECWREHRFLTAWESALLRVGYLTRWVVIVRK
jgi:hypothetical protein